MRFSLLVVVVALLVFQAAPPASAFILIELILRALLKNGLGRTVSTTPGALTDANFQCPCMTQIGCVIENPTVVTADVLPNATGSCPDNSEAMLFMAVNTSKRGQEVVTSNALGCVDLLNATDVAAGCGGAQFHAFGTAECGACTGAGMSWCPGVELPLTGTSVLAFLPPTCFKGDETLRKFPDNVTSVYDMVGAFQSLYGTATTFGLSRERFLNFNPTLGGCPFSATDVPVTAPASCPAESFCPSCASEPAPGGTCTCALPGCCTEDRAFWDAEDPWPTECAPSVTRSTVMWPGETYGDVIGGAVGGDKCRLLGRAWIAANLSICGRGACTDSVVDQALADAVAILFDPTQCPNSLTKSEKQAAQSVTSVLTDFNAGNIGPGPCPPMGAAQVGEEVGSNPEGVSAGAHAGATAQTNEALIITILVFVVAIFLCLGYFVLVRRRRRDYTRAPA